MGCLAVCPEKRGVARCASRRALVENWPKVLKAGVLYKGSDERADGGAVEF